MLFRRARSGIPIELVDVDILDPITLVTRRRIKAEFTFDPNDPFAVHVSFYDKLVGSTRVNEKKWCLSRELLITGVMIPTGAGIGDVTISPLIRSSNDMYVAITMCCPGGAAIAAVPRKPIDRFISKMEKLVPLDEADKFTDTDTELTMLRGSP